MKKSRMKHLDGGTMVTVTVETEEAEIDFEDILEATELVPDDRSEAPWEDADGFEHEVIRDVSDGAAAGYFYGDRHCRHSGPRLVVVEKDRWGNREYLESKGASKQVAFEMARLEERRTAEMIAGWYSSGWEVWGITCDFRGGHDSCWGYYVDSGDPYLEEERISIAMNVAHDLEKEGYEVINLPDPERSRVKSGLSRFRWNLHQQSHIENKDKFVRAEVGRRMSSSRKIKPLLLP